MYFYIYVVCPILEYACPVWHTGLTAAQSDALESVQKRKIIYSDDNSGDDRTRIIISGVDTPKDRVLTERFFQRLVLPSSSLLHCLLSMTLLIVSDIYNHSTNCRFVLPSFATVLTILPKHIHVAVKVCWFFYLLCNYYFFNVMFTVTNPACQLLYH